MVIATKYPWRQATTDKQYPWRKETTKITTPTGETPTTPTTPTEYRGIGIPGFSPEAAALKPEEKVTPPAAPITEPTTALGVEWATPETLDMPEPSAWDTDAGEMVRSSRWFVSPVRTEQQLIVQDEIYKGLLKSEFIPDDQKAVIKQTGQVPATYLRLTPEKLEQIGIKLDPFNAEYLRELQANETKYIYWKSLLEGTEPPSSVGAQFLGGWGDMLNTLGATFNWLGAEGIGETISQEGAKYQRVTPPADWEGVFHPNFWTSQLPRALPFTLALIPAAIIGGYAGASVAGVVGLGHLGQVILGAIGAAGLSRPLESALEAGGVYDQALAQGLSPEEADKAADETFNKNMALVGLDAAEFFLAFAPSPIRTGSRLFRYAMIGGRMVAVGLSEAGEEAVQDIITRQALGEEIKLDAEMEQAIALGFTMGVGLGGVGNAFTAIQEGTKNNLTPELTRIFENARADALKEGKSPEAAELAGLDAVAETPEGKAIIERVVGEVQESEQEKQNSAMADWQTTTGEAQTTAAIEWETYVSPEWEATAPIDMDVDTQRAMIANTESFWLPQVPDVQPNSFYTIPFAEGETFIRTGSEGEVLLTGTSLIREGKLTISTVTANPDIESAGADSLTDLSKYVTEQNIAFPPRAEMSTPARILHDFVTRHKAPEVETTAMAEWETVSGESLIPKEFPTTPPPITPEGSILGRSDNEWEGFMADLQDAQIVADIAFRNDAIRKWASRLPGLRGLMGILNPQVVANTPGERAAIIRATLRDEGYQKTQGVIAHLQEAGSQEKIFGELDSKGFIKEGKLKGQTVGDIAQQRAKWDAKLTDEQKFWLDRAKAIEDSTVEFLKQNEIDVKKLSLEEGGQFATRRVWGKTLEDGTVIDTAYVGAGVGRPGSRLPTEKHRIFRTEAEAIEAGYRYIPYEEALYLKVIGAYNRVADKKMADWLLTQVTWRTTGAPEELILAAESARLEMRHSQMLLAGLNRAVRGERLPDVTLRAIAVSYPDQAQALKDLIPRLQAAKPSAKEIKNLTNVAKGLIDTNKMNFHKAVAARARAREAAMTVKIGEAVIPAPAFSGKILTGPDAKETARTLRQSFEPSFSKVLGEVNKANAVARYFMLAGDYSPFTIQLLFLVGENPKIYGRAFAGAVRAMVNPEFQSKFLAKHKATIDKHPNLLIAKGGTTEFTEAMARGGWLSGKTSFRPEAEAYWKSLSLFLPRVLGKVGGTALTPFQRVFESSLDCAGIYMAEAYEHLCTTPEATADIDQFINEFRGLTSSARIGVSGLQRQVETNILLAPRYNRAIAGLLWSLSRGNIRGHLARRSLIRGIAALSALAVVISMARGEDKDEILEHFNPNSSKFFTWDIAGQKIGPGSKIRSLIKLIAQSSANPDELLEFSMDNPALRFLRGNLAPVAGSAVDLITGRSYIGDPTRDGMLSFSKEILAGNLLPIWVQSALLEGGSPGGRTARGLAEFFGGRAYPEPLWDEVRRLRDKYAGQDFDIKYEDLNRAQIDKLKDNHPDLADLEEKARLEQAERGSEFEQAFYEIREQTIETRNTKLEETATLLLNGSISKYDYDKERGYVRPYYSGGMSTLYMLRDSLDPKAVEDIQEWLSENQKPEDKAMDEYQEFRASLIEKSDLPRDWDAIEEQCGTYLSKLSPKIREYVQTNLHRWINDLPENAKQIELMRLQGIENETWWDDYRGITQEEYPWRTTGEGTSPWEGTGKTYPWRK